MGFLKFNCSFLNYIDLFQQSPSFRINGKPRISLIFGRFFSVLILFFVFYNAFQSDLVNKTNPTVLQQVLQIAERPSINLKNEKFSIAFGVVDDYSNFQIDLSIFSFTVTDIRVVNSQLVEENEVVFEKCEEAHFPQFPEKYQSLALYNMSCLSNDNNITLKGYWDEEEIKYLSISMFACKNNTNNSICQSEESINEFFHLKYFEVYLIQNNFDMKNYDNPLSSKISAYYIGIEPGKRAQVSNFVKRTRILSDKNIIFSNFDEINTYVYEQGETILQKSQDQLLSFEFYSSDNINVFQRNYQKLYDLMASLGGIISPLMIICSFVVAFINDWYINELILMRLYNVNEEKNQQITQIKPSTEKKRNILKSNKKRLFTERKENNFLYLTLYEKIKFMMKPRRFFNKKEKAYQTLLKKAEHKMDLFEILLKIEQIQKIKYILFDEDQKKIFDAFSKKCLSLSSSNRKVKKNQYAYDMSQKQKSKNEINKYVTNMEKRRGEKIDKIDERLLKMIEYK